MVNAMGGNSEVRSIHVAGSEVPGCGLELPIVSYYKGILVSICSHPLVEPLAVCLFCPPL